MFRPCDEQQVNLDKDGLGVRRGLQRSYFDLFACYKFEWQRRRLLLPLLIYLLEPCWKEISDLYQ